jgi:acetyl-CoA acetyltransferase family protein
MRFAKSFVPYGAYWSTPFCKWQGSLAHLNATAFAAECAKRALSERKIEAKSLDGLVLGYTVLQKHQLYGGPYLAALIGAEGITGPMVSQACATGARTTATAAAEIEAGGGPAVLAITADRCSNGAHVYFPNPLGPGGMGEKEDIVMDSFGFDPWAKNSMIQTAENVAAEAGITREQQDACTAIRYRQYQRALENDAAFHRRYMLLPLEVKDASGRKVVAKVQSDEGVFETTREGLAALKPVLPNGTVTFGSQTHPADGNCGMIVASRERAKEISKDPAIEIEIVSYGQGRAKKGFMAMATVPAAKSALDAAGLAQKDMKAIKTHNPFAVNDVYLANTLGIPLESFNNYGSSLIYGHPQGPTGMRLIIELIEELAIAGGGYGLFVGCAAGDTAAAVVIKVGRS